MLLRTRQQRRARAVAPFRSHPIEPCLAALLRARATWVCRIESALAPLGLSSTEYGVLHCLSDADGSLTHGELAAFLSAQRLSGADTGIHSLLEKGLIEQESEEPGANSVRVRITPVGLSRQTEAARAMDEVSARFAAMIADADRPAFDRVVSKVRQATNGLPASRG
jgi:DNA-binding MarR family transcriptional regulator